MKVAIVPGNLLHEANRLDADFFIGDQAEKKVAEAERAVAAANQRLAKAKKELKQRDAERRRLGIRKG